MARAVRYDRYGDVDVLDVVEVDPPTPVAGQAIVEIIATSINPGEIAVREGAFAQQWPTTFPSGQGSDLAGRVVALGDGVTELAVGDEVLGWTDERGAQAEYLAVPVDHLVRKPPALDWSAAGALFIVGVTAYATVRAVAPQQGETVVVSGAAGGVGSLAVQLAGRTGATVIGIAGPSNADWLRSHGVRPVAYGDGLADRLREAASGGVDAFIDTFGSGYVDLALELGVAPERIDTIIDFAAVDEHGVKGEGSASASDPTILAEVAQLVADGELHLEIAATYPLEEVRAAYTRLAERHTRGKIVLRLR